MNEMGIIDDEQLRGTKCLTELIKWDAVLQLFNDSDNEHYRTVVMITQEHDVSRLKSGTRSFRLIPVITNKSGTNGWK
jgi:hypothetical protein